MKTDAEKNACKIAADLLVDFEELKGFSRAKVTAIQPIYSVDGKTIAYYEVKYSSPRNRNNGYAIISATEDDYPVVEFSEKGLTHYERFQKLAKRKDFRMVRFSPAYITAESGRGKLLAEIGVRPFIIPKTLQKHVRGEIRKRLGARAPSIKLSKTVKDVSKFRNEAKKLNYRVFKQRFRPPDRNRTRIREAWEEVRKLKRDPPCDYAYFKAEPQSHPHYLQIDPHTPPNNTSHASGCGPTAWMNLYGWHDYHRCNQLLEGEHTTNDSYINEMTMDLHDYLDVSWAFEQGFTWPEDMAKGVDFAREKLGCDSYYWFDWDWFWTDEDRVFSVARDLARNQLPFIVGYYQDLHYALGLKIAECQEHGWKKHSWIWIYPCWNLDASDDKWIPKSTIFGVYGIYDFIAPTAPPPPTNPYSPCPWCGYQYIIRPGDVCPRCGKPPA